MSDENKEEKEDVIKISLSEDILKTEGFVIKTGEKVEITVLDKGIISG